VLRLNGVEGVIEWVSEKTPKQPEHHVLATLIGAGMGALSLNPGAIVVGAILGYLVGRGFKKLDQIDAGPTKSEIEDMSAPLLFDRNGLPSERGLEFALGEER
jgi:hypothetical protein